MSQQISSKVIYSSLGWKMFERICSQGINLAIQIILARLLVPADFGALAIILSIINFAGIFVQAGFATAIIQKKDIDDKDINTLLTASLFIALILCLALNILSPYISNAYDSPQLKWPLRVLSLILILNAINSVQTAILSRKMKFRQIFLRSIIAVPLSGIIGIVMAYYGFGLWALVTFTLTNVLFTVIIMSFFSDYRLKIGFDPIRFKQMFAFCGNILMSSLVCGFGDTLRTLTIGKKYNQDDLAFYDKAYTYSSYFTQIITSSITSVLLPVFSRTQDNMDELRSKTRRSVRVTAFYIIPFLTIIITISSPFVHLLLTEKWMPCVPFLVVFCVLRIPGCLASIDKQVYFALGNSRINFFYECGLLVANVSMLFLTVPLGVMQIALGYLAVEILGCLTIFIVSSKVYGYSLLMRIQDIWRPIVSSVVLYMVFSLPVFTLQSDLLTMLIKGIGGILVFLLIETILRDDNIQYIMNVVKQQINK